MFLKKMPVGPMSVNSYVIADEITNEAAVIDPGGEAEKIYSVLAENHFQLKYILLTHGHGDHIGGVKGLQEKTQAPVYVHKSDLKMIQDKRKNYSAMMGFPTEIDTSHFLAGGDKLYLGKIELEIIHTPGHSPGGICIKAEKVLFSGDTLFSNSVGRTDLAGGDMDQLVASIQERLLTLDDEVTVFPGHGPASRIGIERLTNPYLK